MTAGTAESFLSDLASDDKPLTRAERQELAKAERKRREEEVRREREAELLAEKAGRMTPDQARVFLEQAVKLPDTTVPATMALAKLNGWLEETGDDPLEKLRGIMATRRAASKPLPDPIPYEAMPYESEIEEIRKKANE